MKLEWNLKSFFLIFSKYYSYIPVQIACPESLSEKYIYHHSNRRQNISSQTHIVYMIEGNIYNCFKNNRVEQIRLLHRESWSMTECSLEQKYFGTRVCIDSDSTTENQKWIFFCHAGSFPVPSGPFVKKRITIQIRPFFSVRIECFEIGCITSPAVNIIYFIQIICFFATDHNRFIFVNSHVCCIIVILISRFVCFGPFGTIVT